MKIVVFGPENRVGALVEGQIVDLNRAYTKYLSERHDEPRPEAMAGALVPADLGAFIEGGPRTLECAHQALEYGLHVAGQREAGLILSLAEARLHCPKPSLGSRIACAGGNYAAHTAGIVASRSGENVTEQEMYERGRKAGVWGFWKVNPTGNGPDDDMIYPSRTERLDYEGEAAVVLGKQSKDLSEAQARDAIWGVTLLIDWSIRDGAEPSRGMSLNLAKNFDTSVSLGPCIVVGEVDPQDIAVKTLINGETRQNYNTRGMTFSFAEFIEYLSRDLALLPGDIVSGGSGPGTALDSSPVSADGRTAPDRFLKVGDVVEVSSPQIGQLRNRIVAKMA